jgi:hypothetical protein
VKIRIPDPIVRAWDRMSDWTNVPIWRGDDFPAARWIKGRANPERQHYRIEVRRIDVILALGFVFCVSWYGFTTGWRGALLGGVMYLAVMAMALWIL